MDIIGSFDKSRLSTIAQEVQRRAKARRDFCAGRKQMSVVLADDELNLKVDGQDTLLRFRRPSLLQLAETLDVPARFLDRLMEKGHNDIAAHNLNELLHRETTTEKGKPRRHLIRTLDNEADAILTDSYRALDNESLLAVCLQETKKAGAEVWDLRLDRDSFRFLAVAPHISGQVSLDRTFKDDTGWMARWQGKSGDVLNAALTVSNSETGHGGLNARPSILRRVCQNFCVWSDGVARVHLGRKVEEGEVFFSDETRKKEDELVWMKIRDTVKATFDPKTFQEKLDLINETTKNVLEAPVAAVEATIKAYALPAEYKEAIIGELLGSGDTTQYGLVQSLTAMVNPKKAGNAPDEVRNRFEDVGGALLKMDRKGFKKLLETATV